MNDLISRSKLLSKLNSTGCEITFDLPVEEILGDDVDIDGFTILIEGAVQVYRKMVIDAICNQPTAYEVDKVVEELKELMQDLNVIEIISHIDFDSTIQNSLNNFLKSFSNKAIEIVKQGGIRKDEVNEE